MAPSIHPVNFFVARRDRKRPLRSHQRRDLGAAIEILPRLLEQGYQYGEPLLNTPPSSLGNGLEPEELLHVDCSFVEPDDLLLQTTRPPLDEELEGPRKQVQRGWTDLEERLFAAWRPWFLACSRRRVVLARNLWGELPTGFESRRDITFYQRNVGACYQRLHSGERGSKALRWSADKGFRTAAYLLRVPEAWQGGPQLLGAFGMDGTANLVWAYRLGRDCASLMTEPGFVVAELSGPPVPERPTNLRWALEWDVKVLVHVRL